MGNLFQTERIHIGERSYEMVGVWNDFFTPNCIFILRVHTEERYYNCLAYGKSFGLKSSLVMHQRLYTKKETLGMLEIWTAPTDLGVAH